MKRNETKASRRNGMKWLAIAAASALPLAGLASGVQAQQRVGSDGHALDANNRIGSNGLNTSVGTGYNPQITPNQVIYGNVTGGRAFQGSLQSTDPRAFRGPTAGVGVDNFVRDSSGAPADYTRNTSGYSAPQAYYGSSRAVAPPTGFVSAGYSGGYVRSPLSPLRSSSDDRLGDVSVGMKSTALPQPGALMLPGPVDNQNNNTVITASPLYGIRQWQPGNAADQYFLDNFTAVGRRDQAGTLNLDQATLANMEQQLRTGGIVPKKLDTSIVPGEGDQSGVSPSLSGANLSQPFGGAKTPPLSDNLAGNRLATGVQTQASVSNQLLTPSQQSSQYAEMRKRFEEMQKLRNLSDEDTQRLFNQKIRLQQQAELEKQKQEQNAPKPEDKSRDAKPGGDKTAPGGQQQSPLEQLGIPDYTKQSQQIIRGMGNNPSGTGGGGTSGMMPGTNAGTGGVAPSAKGAGASKESAAPPPVQVESLATGVGTSGLSNILKRAEQLMREGQYTSAIEQYQSAQQLVPNSALVLVGRANAELGGGYYVQAADHLHRAFTGDPTVLMGQYDLKRFIGADRLTHVINDLKAIAAKNEKDATAMFLLSYVAYNTGNARLAGTWLNEADRRSGYKDGVYTFMRSAWQLPAAPTTQPDLNK